MTLKSTASDAEINAAVAQTVAGWKWVATGYTTDKPPRPRWLTLAAEDTRPPLGWVFFRDQECPNPCNMRDGLHPLYTNDANAVIELLEKFDVRLQHAKTEHTNSWLIEVFVKGTGIISSGWRPSFCRADCIALLRAHGVTIV